MLSICLAFFATFSLFSVEKVFLHRGEHDRFVIYLNPKADVSSCLSKAGNLRLSVKGASCNNVSNIKDRVPDSHYHIKHTDTNSAGVCHIDIAPKHDSVVINKPLSFKAINGKDAMSVDIKKSATSKIALCRRPVIVIDPGHGGSDSGTVSVNGCAEKTVVLSVAKELKIILQKAGLQVALTRDKDNFVKLDDRTSFANKYNCALFISLHANSAPSKEAQGIETFYFEGSLLKQKNSSRDDASKSLAFNVQQALLDGVKGVKDRKVKKAVSQILLGTHHPSILVELGFLSNAAEAKKLSNYQYQQRLAEGVASGIQKYLSVPA